MKAKALVETLDRAQLQFLAQTRGSNCVSLFLPTHRAGPETRQDPIRFKNLIKEAESKLVSGGLRPARRLRTKTARRSEVSQSSRPRKDESSGPEPKGHIVRVFSDEGYGYLEAPDGREIYFHRNAVVGEEFEKLRVGAPVEFNEEAGEEGPHATIVKVDS